MKVFQFLSLCFRASIGFVEDLLRFRLLVCGVLHPHRHVRGDHHGYVLLPALQRGLPLVRIGDCLT